MWVTCVQILPLLLINDYRPWVIYLSSLYLSFFICQMGMLILMLSTLQSRGK